MAATLSMMQQERLIRMQYSKAKTFHRTHNSQIVLWTDITLQVAPVFETYRVFISYTLGVRPMVYVHAPELIPKAHGIPTPHLNYDGSLCLYDPDKKQWTDTDAIAHTTIPWALRWLLHYENWLSTGVWLGDTDQPVVTPRPFPDWRSQNELQVSCAESERGRYSRGLHRFLSCQT